MYRPLNPSRREVRVIQLDKGGFDDAIHCSFQVVSLDENPIYEALSYVWGSSELRSSIMLQGVATEVTVNLKLALQHLRRSDQPRILWADAICINQTDTAERNHQVAQMGDIYSSATAVVAWLGEEFADSHLALAAVEAMAADQRLHWDQALEPSLETKFLSRDYVQSICTLLDRPWWHRLWTVPESILPRNFSFLCGTQELLSTVLFAAVLNYFHHSTTCCYGLSKVDGGALLRALNGSLTMIIMLQGYRQAVERLNILELISLYRERQCSDPRDKVYALLGLARGVHARLVEPDYSKSAHQVFEEAAAMLLRRSGGLQVLSLILPPTSQGASAGPADLPSWAPDWMAEGSHTNYRDLHIRMERLTMYSATGSSTSTVQYLGHGRLAARATIIGTIAKIGKARDSGEGRDHNETYKSWRRMAQVDTDPDTNYPLLTTNSQTNSHAREWKDWRYSDAYWLTLCGSISRAVAPFQPVLIRDPQSHRKLHDAWWKWITFYDADVLKLADIQAEYGVPVNEIGNFITDISVTTGMRRLFLTSGDLGLIGLAPRNARIGDAIALIEEGRVPFIVRESVDSNMGRVWRLVGDSYVHGIMEGEGLGLGKVEDIIII